MATTRVLPEALSRISPDDRAKMMEAAAKLILDEVAADPEGRGYAGQTPAGIADRLNNEIPLLRRRPSPLSRIAHPDVPPAFATLTEALEHPELGGQVADEIRHDPTGRGYLRVLGDPAAVLRLLTSPWHEEVGRMPPRWPRLIQGTSHVPSTIGAGDIADLLGVPDGD